MISQFGGSASAGIVFAKCHLQLKLIMLLRKGHTPTCVAECDSQADSDTVLDSTEDSVTLLTGWHVFSRSLCFQLHTLQWLDLHFSFYGCSNWQRWLQIRQEGKHSLGLPSVTLKWTDRLGFRVPVNLLISWSGWNKWSNLIGCLFSPAAPFLTWHFVTSSLDKGIICG